jgi:hypothetical protein
VPGSFYRIDSRRRFFRHFRFLLLLGGEEDGAAGMMDGKYGMVEYRTPPYASYTS